MESIVNQAFKKAIQRLINDKKVKNKKEIASSLNLSPQYFTEILGGRVKVSGELLQTLFSKYPINPQWIFSKSDDFYVITPPILATVDMVSEPLEDYTPKTKSSFESPTTPETASPTASPTHINCILCHEKERLISQLEKTIIAQDRLIEQLNKSGEGGGSENGKKQA